MRFLVTCALFGLPLLAAPSPPERIIFHRSGVFEGGDTRNLNLEKISLGKKGDVEVFDFSFTAGSKKVRSPRIPPYQLRLDSKTGSEFGRLVLLLQGISLRNVQRLMLEKLVKQSALVESFHLYPPLEDGDMVVELKLKAKVEFKDIATPGVLQVLLSPDGAVPQLGKPKLSN